MQKTIEKENYIYYMSIIKKVVDNDEELAFFFDNHFGFPLDVFIADLNLIFSIELNF